jgi:hypothetical protein
MRDSDHPWWRKFFSKSWHKTLRQSVENPLQSDRLPTDVAPEFDYPVSTGSFAASQWQMLMAAFLTLMLTILCYSVFTFAGECGVKFAKAASNSGRPGDGIAAP